MVGFTRNGGRGLVGLSGLIERTLSWIRSPAWTMRLESLKASKAFSGTALALVGMWVSEINPTILKCSPNFHSICCWRQRL